MRAHHALPVPPCAGVDHMDFTAGRPYLLASLRVRGRDDRGRRHARAGRAADRAAARRAMPQDVKLSPDGRTFYVADMASNGVWLIDARRLRVIALRAAPARARTASTRAATRSRSTCPTAARASISVISFRTRAAGRASGASPAAARPDMGGVSADGRVLWLSGRYDGEVYAITTRTGRLLAPHPGRAPARTAYASGRSRAATRSGTPASCASGAGPAGRARGAELGAKPASSSSIRAPPAALERRAHLPAVRLGDRASRSPGRGRFRRLRDCGPRRCGGSARRPPRAGAPGSPARRPRRRSGAGRPGCSACSITRPSPDSV